MNKTKLYIVLVIFWGCVDIEQIGLFMSESSKIDKYDFTDSLSNISPDLWSYIPSEQSKITDAIYIKAIDSAAFKDKIVIFFLGNDCNLKYGVCLGKLFHVIGINYYSVDYPGYGRGYGTITPSEQTCYQGAASGIEYVIDSLGFQPSDIVICGVSLGTGVAIEMATRYKVSAVLLYSVFTNMEAIIENGTGGYKIPGDWLMEAEFDNISKIDKINAPLCMFSGDKDCLMEPQNMYELYKKAKEPKYQYLLKDEAHSCFPVNSYMKWKDIVVDFLSKMDNSF